MTVVTSSSFVVSAGTDNLDGNSPIIGYDNRVTSGNIAATTAATGFPASNLGNPATHLKWKSNALPTVEETLTVTFEDDGQDIDYMGIAGHNFGSNQAPVSVQGNAGLDAFTKSLLHFNGADASTTFTDETGKTWTASGNAQLDTAQKKFGASSMLCDGTGDFISTPDHADFTLGSSDFTIDAWFNCNKALGTEIAVAGQTDDVFTVVSSWLLRRESTGVMVFYSRAHSGSAILTGTTVFSNAVNTGWHHVAVTRSGNTFRLFVDGIIEDSQTFSGPMTDSNQSLYIGQRSSGTDPWLGWIDEFKLSVGVARWTADFIVPEAEHPWVTLVGPQLLPNDAPAIFRFTKSGFDQIRLVVGAAMADDAATAFLAVMYVGELLLLQRRIYVGHTPIPYGRRLVVANHRSIAGAFLGRVVLSEKVETGVEMKNLTPTWYRSYFEPFLLAAREIPFFFNWRPGTYPFESGYAWLSGDPQPSNQLPNGMMQVSFEIEGIVA